MSGSRIATISSISYNVGVVVHLPEPIALPLTEHETVRELNRLLSTGAPAQIATAGGRVDLPDAVQEVLRKVVDLMAHGHAVALVTENQVVTTQRAADILGMSRPFFIKLLESGAMGHHRVGNQRRVYLRDVLAFARKRDEDRQAALDQLTRDAFEAGLYDRNAFPENGQDE